MEQRTYRGDITPQDLAYFLVQHFDPQENLQAQEIGQEGTHLVQIGRGDVPKDIRHAVTVAIAPVEDSHGITVTMGEQKWIDAKMTTFAAVTGLIGLLVTPFALFALLWPLSDAVGGAALPADIWDSIDTYVASRGGALGESQRLQHPHAR